MSVFLTLIVNIISSMCKRLKHNKGAYASMKEKLSFINRFQIHISNDSSCWMSTVLASIISKISNATRQWTKRIERDWLTDWITERKDEVGTKERIFSRRSFARSCLELQLKCIFICAERSFQLGSKGRWPRAEDKSGSISLWTWILNRSRWSFAVKRIPISFYWNRLADFI